MAIGAVPPCDLQLLCAPGGRPVPVPSLLPSLLRTPARPPMPLAGLPSLQARSFYFYACANPTDDSSLEPLLDVWVARQGARSAPPPDACRAIVAGLLRHPALTMREGAIQVGGAAPLPWTRAGRGSCGAQSVQGCQVLRARRAVAVPCGPRKGRAQGGCS